jgi:serine phosphatase RsbU (regulator of sigma subunit)
MAKLSAEARYCLLMHQDLGEAVARLNEQLLQAGMMDRFVTLSASLLNPKKHTVTIASAGHEPPLVYRRATNSIEEGISADFSSFPLGMLEGTQYKCNTIELSPGDCMVVFTDGVTDALNLQNVPFGMERIRKAVLGDAPMPEEKFTAPEIGKRIIAAVQKHASGQYQNDDIALVCYGRLDEPLVVPGEGGRISTATGPMTQTIKRLPKATD